MKTDGKRWVKLYVDESEDFQKLSLTARAYGAYFLKIAAKYEGRIPVMDVVVRYFGATKHDRELMVRIVLPQLLKDGYLVEDGEGYVVRNFVEAQAVTTKRAASAQRGRTNGAASEQPASSERAGLGQSASSTRDDSKPPPSEIEREEEKEESPERVSTSSDFDIGKPWSIAWVSIQFEKVWIDVYGPGRPKRGDESGEIRKWLEANDEKTLARLYPDFSGMVRRYLANKKPSLVAQKHPLIWFLSDIAAYMQDVKKATAAHKPLDVEALLR